MPLAGGQLDAGFAGSGFAGQKKAGFLAVNDFDKPGKGFPAGNR
jgi:hypothetical protein